MDVGQRFQGAGHQDHTHFPGRKDGGCRSWLVVLGAFLAQVLAVGGFYSFGMFVVPFTEAFDVGRGRAAAVGSTMAFGFLASAPFTGRLGDRVGNRRIVALGALVSAAGLAGGSFVESIWGMYFTYGMTLGLGSSMLYVCAAATIGHWFERRLGLAMGLAIAGGGLGNIIFPPLIKAVMDAHGWRWSLRMLAASYVLIGFAATALIQRRVPVPSAMSSPSRTRRRSRLSRIDAPATAA